MLRPRIIPCLLIKNKGLVKTVNFKNPKYVGDPINTIKIFNEKEVDELIVLDIEATTQNREPDYTMIKNIATECRMPLCYGGGIKTIEQAKKIISLGVEKVALSSAFIDHPELIGELVKVIGSQSIIAVLDIKKKGFFNKYQIYTHNATVATDKNLITFSKYLETLGIGELLINSVDNDGFMKGYDLKLIELIRANINIPITVLGGAGHINHIKELIQKYKIIGIAAGSLFVFKGKYKAVLVNYPNRNERNILIQS